MDGSIQAPEDPVPSLSDAELLVRQFTIDDPEGLDNLSKLVPHTNQTPVIEYIYNVTPPKGESRPYVRCTHCNRPNHWRGYVMRCRDGVRFLVGIDCGTTIYGANFLLIEQDFSTQRRRQAYLQRLENIRFAFPSMLQALKELPRDPVFDQYESCRQDLRVRMPQLWRKLSQLVARNEAALIIKERVRDYAAEERRADRNEEEPEEDIQNMTVTRRKALRKAGKLRKPNAKEVDPIYTYVDRTIGALSGGPLFDDKAAPRRTLVVCYDHLETLYHRLSRQPSDHFSTIELKQLLETLRTHFKDIDEQMLALDDVRKFFDPDNLKSVANWASNARGCDGRYESLGTTLMWHQEESADKKVLLSLPVGYRLPHPEAITKFKNTLVQ